MTAHKVLNFSFEQEFKIRAWHVEKLGCQLMVWPG